MTETVEEKKPVTCPPYVLALFEGEDGGSAGAAGDGGGNDGGTSGDGGTGGGGSSTTTTVTKPAVSSNGNTNGGVRSTASRDGGGRFIPVSDDPAELRAALDEARRSAESANTRISELNRESQTHRQTAQKTKEQLDAVSSQVELTNKRAIRSEAKAAMLEAGVVSPKIVNLFLDEMGEKVAIDKKTGEPVGIHENLPSWIKENAAFFKAATTEKKPEDKPADDAGKNADGSNKGTDANDKGGAGGDGKQQNKDDKSGGTQTDDKSGEKQNSTSKGASPAGGGDGKAGIKTDLPDLTQFKTPRERRDAFTAWKKGLRSGRN